jgi:anti-sigma-K factor RskA
MIDEQLEFAISQYADGTLPVRQHAALEARLTADPALMALLEEYRQLGNAMKVADPLPAIQWDRLTSHLSDCVAQTEAEPVHVYQMPWVRRVAGMAIAACLAVVIGVSFDRHSTPKAVVVPMVAGQLAVAGPVADAPAGAVVSEIAIGPSPAVAMDDSTFRYGDSGVVAQPQRVVIASSDAPVQDTSAATPY